MKKLTCYELDCLAIGSAILGSGGGGDPSYDILMAKYQVERFGPIQLLDIEELADNDLVVPLAFMGAPLVGIEKIPSGREFTEMMPILKKTMGKAPSVLMPAEIGGGNAFTPLTAACQLGLPVLDADTIGRAFPELQMSSCTIFGHAADPAFITDSFGNTVVIHAKNSHSLEKLARQATIAMGSSAAIALYLMSGMEAKKITVPGSITRAIEIGRAFLQAKEEKTSPTEAVLKITGGMRIISGKIIDIQQTVEGGFLTGSVIIQQGPIKCNMIYKNEYLMAICNEKVLATTPDILMILEQETGRPITSESLQFGLQVDLIALPSPSIWTTPQGLSLVGPAAFGLNAEYNPIHNSSHGAISLC